MMNAILLKVLLPVHTTIMSTATNDSVLLTAVSVVMILVKIPNRNAHSMHQFFAMDCTIIRNSLIYNIWNNCYSEI